MADLDLQQRVQTILEQFRGPDAPKKLFWSGLSYPRVNDPLSRRNWPESISSLVAEDPVLLSEQDGFAVVYVRLQSSELSRSAERQVAGKLLSQHPFALFVFSNAERDKWHFLNVKRDGANPEQRVFRRIAVGPGERVRTAVERLSMLDLESLGANPTALEIQNRHDEAFDVEKVTKRFFEEYARVFGRVEGLIEGIPKADRKRLFTQRLFNRLMFIAFIQKKGWLKLGGSADYLEALWRDYQRNGDRDAGFYDSRLKLLFFSGLNTRGEVDMVGINATSPLRNTVLESIIGRVPYLNGGLFEEDGDDTDAAIHIPDAAIDSIIHDLFARFNFTVTESTPLDVEVAVDPEMLGKVFEELVTGRHETGSYYTPKPVVAFMGREALKGYLRAHLPKETQDAVERFVDGHDPAGLHDPEAVLEALKRIRVCDPACGSGAYLLGMLHELLELRDCLFVSHNLDPLKTYDRKLEIIQNSLYGVDLDPFAVNIARLRLWLSLAVDFDDDDPPPLPNLDFKIEAGDSLLAPVHGTEKQETARSQLIAGYLDLKARYMTAHHGEKRSLLKEIEKQKEAIQLWTHGGAVVQGFDWPVEFAEVFLDGGFDVVLANPPYVRADAQYRHIEDVDERQRAIEVWRKYRATLVKRGTYHTLYKKWDLYIPFLERGFQLMQPGGQMVFIIPDAYNSNEYASKSHELLVASTRIERLDFCSDIPLFDAGVANTILHVSKIYSNDEHRPVRARRWGSSSDDFERNVMLLPTAGQTDAGTSVFRPDGATVGLPAKSMLPLGSICYVTVGMVIHCDEKKGQGLFRAEDLVAGCRDKRHPRPYVEGKDVQRWEHSRVRYLEYGTDRAPSMFRRPTFPELYEVSAKLLAARMPGETPAVLLDTGQLSCNHTVVVLVPWHELCGVRNRSIQKTVKYRNELRAGESHTGAYREDLELVSTQYDAKYLLAVANSSYATGYVNARRRSKLDIYPDDWKPLPIFPASMEQQAVIVALVDQILALYDKHGYPLPSDAEQRLAELEAEIDRKVAELHEQRESVAASQETGG